MVLLRAVALFGIIINFAAIIANAFGIRWLIGTRKPYSNQIKIIVNISLVDICISAMTLLTRIVLFAAPGTFYVKVYTYVNLVRLCVYLTWFFMFYLLMLDRFLGCCFPLWYRVNASPNWIKFSLGFCWSIALVSAPITCLISPDKMKSIMGTYVMASLLIMFLIQFAVLYVAVFYHKRRSNARSGRQNKRVENTRFFAVTTVMLVAFLALEAIPSLALSVMQIAGVEYAKLFTHWFQPLWDLNLFVDPIIYIFMRPNAGRALRNCLGAFCVCLNRESSAATSANNQNRVGQLETGM